jgi:undecaprenyl-diphosphatase
MTMTNLQMLILAIVQGITEFLPISSSGHLVVIEALMGVAHDATDVNIVLHAGTLGSILIFYWRRIWRLLLEDRRVIGPLIVGTIPAVIAGLFIKEHVDRLLESPVVAGLMLPVTGLMLLWISRRQPGDKTYQQLSYRDALTIGLFQAVAITPGISRSGATIVAGLMVGLKRQDAATFSFLLAIPVISGAVLLSYLDMQTTDAVATTQLTTMLWGAVLALLVGLLALQWLIGWVVRGKLYYFAWWCIPLGIAVLAWQGWLFWFASGCSPAAGSLAQQVLSP